MRQLLKIILLTPFLTLVLSILFIFFHPSPLDSDYPKIFIVDKDTTIRQVADDLKNEGVIRSSDVFVLASYLLGNKVLAGTYYLYEPVGTFDRARQFVEGRINAPIQKLIIKEQTTIHDIADEVANKFPDIDREVFFNLAIEYPGKLYPDTYFFPRGQKITEKDIVEFMANNFYKHVDSLINNYNGSLTKNELITFASILELEATRYEDRRKIAGVLLNRIEQDIPLQVDVSFLYINRKGTYQLSKEDLKLDHPFNSYVNLGLPPMPISNPTFSSIEAAIDPDRTHNYLYFLADRQGNTYYSETFEEHKQKKSIYVDV